MKKVRIGLLGLGQIGSGVYRLLTRKKAFLAQKTGCLFEITKVAVKHASKPRAVSPGRRLLTTRGSEVVSNGSVDCVVELIGGLEPARKFILQALRSGKDVVTANKALLAEHGEEIFRACARYQRKVFFEASVGGGIPLIKALREGLIGNHIHGVLGIINGTCNYILTRMTRDGLEFGPALAQAQKEGYAEKDPGLDIDGVDSAHKLAILASLAFDQPVRFSDITCEGIRGVDHGDIAFAREFGYVVKLLAVAKRAGRAMEARVAPVLLPRDHILAKVEGAYNAVLFRGDEVGEVLLYGKGAGAQPTASAVISDLADLALGREEKKASPWLKARRLKVKPLSSTSARFYTRFSVIDKPGVLAKIASVLGRYRVSISDVIQTERKSGTAVPLIMLTHETSEEDVRGALGGIGRLDVVKGKPHLLRLED